MSVITTLRAREEGRCSYGVWTPPTRWDKATGAAASAAPVHKDCVLKAGGGPRQQGWHFLQ